MAEIDVEQWLEGWVERHLREDVEPEAFREAIRTGHEAWTTAPVSPVHGAAERSRDLAVGLIADALTDGISTAELKIAVGSDDLEGYLADRAIALARAR